MIEDKYEMPEEEISGFMRPKELQWLYEQAQKFETIVEVGSWRGRSTHSLLSGKATVYALDHYNGSPMQLKEEHEAAKTNDISMDFYNHVGKFKNLVTVIGYNEESVKLFNNKSVDMVFIDADHEYERVMADIKNWMPKCKKMLAGHDVNHTQVSDALRDSGLKYTVPVNAIWAVCL